MELKKFGLSKTLLYQRINITSNITNCTIDLNNFGICVIVKRITDL